ncbi:hypothetical protein ACFYO6_35235 [Streptomyces anthocyanicus]|nr:MULTISPECIES: hypothetical protein [Streptomyces]
MNIEVLVVPDFPNEEPAADLLLLDDSLYEYEGGGWRHSRWT